MPGHEFRLDPADGLGADDAQIAARQAQIIFRKPHLGRRARGHAGLVEGSRKLYQLPDFLLQGHFIQ